MVAFSASRSPEVGSAGASTRYTSTPPEKCDVVTAPSFDSLVSFTPCGGFQRNPSWPSFGYTFEEQAPASSTTARNFISRVGIPSDYRASMLKWKLMLTTLPMVGVVLVVKLGLEFGLGWSGVV